MEHALSTAGQPVNFGTMAHDHEIYMMLADAAAELRDHDAIQEYASHLEELAGRDEHRLYLAIAQRALGVGRRLAGEGAAAEALLGRALAGFSELGARWQIGRTLFELGEATLAHSPQKAREYYAQALGAFEEIGAAPNAEKTRAAMRT